MRILSLCVSMVMVAAVSVNAGPQPVAKSASALKIPTLNNRVAYTSVSGVKLRPIKGGLIDMSYYKGKVVLVVYFATWCPPCLKEIPDLIAMQRALAPRGFQVIGISVDGQKSALASFVNAQKITYPIVYDNPDLADIFGDVQAIPTAYLIDRKLRIVDKWTGYHSRREVESRIAKWL